MTIAFQLAVFVLIISILNLGHIRVPNRISFEEDLLSHGSLLQSPNPWVFGELDSHQPYLRVSYLIRLDNQLFCFGVPVFEL